VILETTFLVDLEREARSGRAGPATKLLEELGDTRVCITLTTAGEMACGPRIEGRSRWSALVKRFVVLAPDVDTAWRYGQIYRFLKANGLLIGTNDLWIAATALTHDLPLVTRNIDEFRRVPDLRLRSY
jgi:tRNA(fMet)-specific endonuclease VapC